MTYRNISAAKMKNIAFPAFLALLLLTSCAKSGLLSSTITSEGNTSSGTVTPSPMRLFRGTLPSRWETNTPIPPTPTSTKTSTPAPYPDLHSAGPYLFIPYIHDILYEMDGSGRRNASISNDQYCSPDLRWCAEIIGNILPDYSGLASEDYFLQIVNRWNGETRYVASLLPPDFYARQVKMVNDFLPEYITHAGEENKDRITVNGAMYDIHLPPVWSPNSQYLAFAAMIDGNSTDVYLYNLDTKIVERKEDGKLDVGHISWSPDSKWINYQNWLPSKSEATEWFSDWNPTPEHIVSADSANINTTLGNLVSIRQWASDDEWLLAEQLFSSGGPPPRTPLTILSTSSQAYQTIWPGGAYYYALNPMTKDMILYGYEYCPRPCTSPVSHLYYGPLYGQKNQISNVEANVFLPKSASHPFLAIQDRVSGSENAIWDVTKDGKMNIVLRGGTILSSEHLQFSNSPNQQWTAVYDEDGLILLDKNNSIAFEDDSLTVFSAAWKTNSEGLFLLTTDEVRYLNLKDNAIGTLFTCVPGNCQKDADLFLLSDIHMPTLPYLRAQPPSIEDQTKGLSIWSKTAFEDLSEPEKKEYNVTIPAYSTWRWDFSWCAKDAATLADILKPFNIRFFIGGQEIGEDIFRIYDQAGSGGYCRNWATLLSGWQPGDATDLGIRYALGHPVNDGTREYPAGEYRQIIHIQVK